MVLREETHIPSSSNDNMKQNNSIAKNNPAGGPLCPYLAVATACNQLLT